MAQAWKDPQSILDLLGLLWSSSKTASKCGCTLSTAGSSLRAKVTSTFCLDKWQSKEGEYGSYRNNQSKMMNFPWTRLFSETYWHSFCMVMKLELLHRSLQSPERILCCVGSEDNSRDPLPRSSRCPHRGTAAPEHQLHPQGCPLHLRQVRHIGAKSFASFKLNSVSSPFSRFVVSK